MNCNFHQLKSYRLLGLNMVGYPSLCKSCVNKRICGYSKINSNCSKYRNMRGKR